MNQFKLLISLLLVFLAIPVFSDEVIESTYTAIPNVFRDAKDEILKDSDKIETIVISDTNFSYPVVREIYSKKLGKRIFIKRIYVPLYNKKSELIGKCNRGEEVLISTSAFTSNLLFEVWKGTYTIIP